jgi:hypothetical protein
MKILAALVLSIPLACSTAGAAAASLAPGDASISLNGEAGKQSEIHTIRFELAPGEQPPALTFTPGDLQRTVPTPSRIDRAQVHVTPVPGAALYQVMVTGLPEWYGSYTGTIQVSDADHKPYPPIKVTLLVRVPSTQSLAASPANLALQLAAGSRRSAGALSNWPSAVAMPVVIAGLPSGVEIADVYAAPLTSVRGYGEFGGTYGVTKQPRGLVFHADASRARPEKYTSVAELALVGSDRRISVPVEVLVRASPWRVLMLLFFGIVFGRAVKWMNEQGQKLLAAQQRVNDIKLRSASLDPDYRRHLDDRLVNLQRRVSENRLAAFDAALADAGVRADLLERAASLKRFAAAKSDTAAQTALDTFAQEVQFVTKPETLQARLDAVEAALMSAPGADAAAAPPSRGAAPSAMPRGPSVLVRLVGATHWTLEFAAVALLAFVGYEVLYLNGPPTFGANFSDYFGAFVWGLSADVAARGIASLGRTVVR